MLDLTVFDDWDVKCRSIDGYLNSGGVSPLSRVTITLIDGRTVEGTQPRLVTPIGDSSPPNEDGTYRRDARVLSIRPAGSPDKIAWAYLDNVTSIALIE
jgi:hypothetical protein